MLVNIVLILVLALAFYQGYRQGLALQLIRILGYGITLVLATSFKDTLAKWISLVVPFPAIQPDTEFAMYNEELSFFVDDAYYSVLTFLAILFIGYLVTKILTVFFSKIQHYVLFDKLNGLLGGLVNLFVTYIIVFLILFAVSLLPVEWVQQQFVNYPILYWIVSSTPIISQMAMDAWLTANPFI